MSQNNFKALVAVLLLTAATTAYAETKSLVKTNNFSQSASDSPWFNLGVDGVTPYGPAQDVNANDMNQGHTVSFKPSTTGTQAGQLTSIQVNGTYSIKGYSTAASNFTDFNGIPAGITMTFKTAMTFSVDAGNYLTLVPTASNGLGIGQTSGTSSTFDANETLHASAVTVSDIAFTGSVLGYTFSNPTISNFGINVLRSGAGSDFNEPTENAGLYSVPPDGSGNPTIGFGDGALGTGVVQSNVKIDNGFAAAGTNFATRYLGAWDLTMRAGAMALRGVGFQYDLGYDINAVPFIAGDYNKNGVVDAADYVVWRKGDPTADGTGDTIVDQADYDFWRARFENTSGAGAGGGLSAGSVPEPTSAAMIVLGLIGSLAWRRGGRQQA